MATAAPSGRGRGRAEIWNILVTNSDRVNIYEDPTLQKQARSCLPLVELTKSAMHNHQKNNETAAKKPQERNGAKPMDVRDFLLFETMKWFKESFFTWTDSPRCSLCNSATSPKGAVSPTPDDLKWGASRVEGYTCSACNKSERFPRYNHPGKLLETRTGRCGEWANCFTLVCRAVGFQARYIYDMTDHVWTEVYSESQQRWLHCDPCENCVDKPLLYEHGWGKRLSYVFAFSKDEVVDVTWRYSSKHAELLSRRTKCDEFMLIRLITAVNKRLQTSLTPDQISSIQTRLIRETVEFLSTREAADGEAVGRISGSLDWRRSRMEVGSNCDTGAKIKLTNSEKINKKFHMGYSAARDEYVRYSDNERVVKQWPSLVYKAENVLRKVEHDWKMVYIARTETADRSSITWLFDFTESGLSVDKITIKIATKTYETGQIRLSMSGGSRVKLLTGDDEFQYLNDFQGVDSLILSAEMSGGEGSVAWQHTQLFRQSIDSTVMPFEITIDFK